jgi:hypothetical protein
MQVNLPRTNSNADGTDAGSGEELTKDFSNARGVHRFRGEQRGGSRSNNRKHVLAPCPMLHVSNIPAEVSGMCTALYCTVLHYTALYCTILHCTALYCTILHHTALYCTILHCTAQYCTMHLSNILVRLLTNTSKYTSTNASKCTSIGVC